MRVELSADTCDRVTLETLKEWYEDADRCDDILLKALEVVIDYGTTEAEYREWEAQRSAE